jgi:hypothetical protein
MPQDNIALRSQEFGLAANQSVEPARAAMQQSIQNFTSTLMQGAQMAQQRNQQNRAFDLQQQEQDVRKEVAVSSIALDRVRKQQALEELNWSRELHTTAMLENQRRVSTAQADLLVAEAEEKKRNLGMAKTRPGDVPSYEMNQIIAQGSMWDPQSGAIRDATPQEKADAQKWLDREDAARESVIERNRAAAEGYKRLQQGTAAQGSLRVQALRERVTTLMAQQENLKYIRAVTEQEKADKATKAAGIQDRLEKAEKALEELGASPEAEESPSPQSPPSPPAKGKGTVGDNFYLDTVRSITGGK